MQLSSAPLRVPTNAVHPVVKEGVHTAASSTPVKFYDSGKPFYEFTNFYEPPGGIVIEGLTWRTTEAFFQARKFPNSPLYRAIHQLRTPREAFQLAQDNRQSVRADWQKVSVDVMFEAVFCKFSQHPHLKKLLLSTGNRELIEHTKNDSFWGDGGDGTGQNQLGKVLMKVREILTQR
jgi:N-glycosidase YbiA